MNMLKITILLISFTLTTLISGKNTIKIGEIEAYSQLETLSEEIADKILDKYDGKKGLKVVVIPFINGKNKYFCDLGHKTASFIKNFLFLSKKFEILERIQLSNLLEELELVTTSDLFNKDNLSKIGKFAGADAVLVGEIIEMKGYYSVNAKIINIEEAKVLTMGTDNLASENFTEDFNNKYKWAVIKKNGMTKFTGEYKVTINQFFFKNLVNTGSWFFTVNLLEENISVFKTNEYIGESKKIDNKHFYFNPIFNETFKIYFKPNQNYSLIFGTKTETLKIDQINQVLESFYEENFTVFYQFDIGYLKIDFKKI